MSKQTKLFRKMIVSGSYVEVLEYDLPTRAPVPRGKKKVTTKTHDADEISVGAPIGVEAKAVDIFEYAPSPEAVR